MITGMNESPHSKDLFSRTESLVFFPFAYRPPHQIIHTFGGQQQQQQKKMIEQRNSN